jgi:hypothetical protein
LWAGVCLTQGLFNCLTIVEHVSDLQHARHCKLKLIFQQLISANSATSSAKSISSTMRVTSHAPTNSERGRRFEAAVAHALLEESPMPTAIPPPLALRRNHTWSHPQPPSRSADKSHPHSRSVNKSNPQPHSRSVDKSNPYSTSFDSKARVPERQASHSHSRHVMSSLKLPFEIVGALFAPVDSKQRNPAKSSVSARRPHAV